MIIVVVLNGWGSSSRRSESRTSELVRDSLGERDYHMLSRRARIGYNRARKFRRFIRANQSPERTMLCVGKSLGARNMIKAVLNRLKPLNYRRVALVTIDLNYPIIGDWRPNLNDTSVMCKYPVDLGYNIRCRGEADQQCGAEVTGTNIIDTLIDGWDHKSIVYAPETINAIKQAIEFLEQ